MEFHANLPVEHFKVFSAIADLFLHFNEVINLDIRNNQFILSTFNHSVTAQGLVRFSPSFFQDYKLLRHGSEESSLNCTVYNKKLNSILKKNSGSIDMIQMCQISILPSVPGTESKLTMRLIYKNGTKKTNNISYQDGGKTLQLYDKKQANHFIMNTHTIRECFIRFDPRVSDILLSCLPNSITLSTYIDPQKKIRPSHYSYTVDITDCIEYSIIEPVNVVINLKELQAIVDFADSLEIPIHALFEEVGKPIVFIYRESDKVILDIALMTQEIEEPDQSTPQTTNDELSYEFVQTTQTPRSTNYSSSHDHTTTSPAERGISSRSTLTMYSNSSQYTNYNQLSESQQSNSHSILSGNDGGDEEESLEPNMERQESIQSSQQSMNAGSVDYVPVENSGYDAQQRQQDSHDSSVLSTGNEEEEEEEPLFPPSYSSSSSLSTKRKTTLQMLREKKRPQSTAAAAAAGGGGSSHGHNYLSISSSGTEQEVRIKQEPTRRGDPAISLRRKARRLIEESE